MLQKNKVMILGHLQRADPSGRRKRSILVRMRRAPDRIYVAVRPVWPGHAVARHILSDASHFGQHWPFDHYISKFETMEEYKYKINKIKSCS
jgi:hypothetical protein